MNSNLRFCTVLLLLFCSLLSAQSQDLFDKQHTEEFSNYLMKTGQYRYACQELERLLYSDSKNDSLKIQLLRSYRLDENYNAGIQRFLDFAKTPPPASMQLRREYVNLLLLNRSFDRLSVFNALPNIQPCERAQALVQQFSLQQDWTQLGKQDLASSCLSSRDQEFYQSLYTKGVQGKRKSPGLALGMSAIVPGTGKVYTGEWKDGIMSFVFVASMAWQSYRGFKRKGSESVYGWVFGGMATGFYAGNLFGSHKSARMYNERKQELLAKEIEHYIYNGF